MLLHAVPPHGAKTAPSCRYRRRGKLKLDNIPDIATFGAGNPLRRTDPAGKPQIMPTTDGYGTKYAARSSERYEPDGQARPPRRRKTEGLLPPAGEAAVPFGPVPEAEKKPALGAASRYRTDTPAGASGRTRKPIPTWQKETTTVLCPSL